MYVDGMRILKEKDKKIRWVITIKERLATVLRIITKYFTVKISRTRLLSCLCEMVKYLD